MRRPGGAIRGAEHRRVACLLVVLGCGGLATGAAVGDGSAAARVVDVGEYRLAILPATPLPPLRVFGNDGAQEFEGRRGVEITLSGTSLEPTLPALGGKVQIKTDTGEELEVKLPAGETTHAPDGRHFSTRYPLDLSRLRQPCREVRLRGEIWTLRPLETIRKRVELALGDEMLPRDVGPLRISASPGAADGGATLSVTCEWDAPPDAPDPLPTGREIAGPIEADLVTAGGALCRLAQVVSVDKSAGGAVRRAQTFVWRVAEGGRGELRLSYPRSPRQTTPFTVDRVPLPEPDPPALGRIGAQRMEVDGRAAILEALDLLEPEGPQGDAPHPLLDPVRGGALQFRLQLAGGITAGEGAIDAALAPRAEASWGGWHWFTGRTDARGEATLANVKPGTYRLRIRFRPRDAGSASYWIAEGNVTVRAGETLQLPHCQLRTTGETRRTK